MKILLHLYLCGFSSDFNMVVWSVAGNMANNDMVFVDGAGGNLL